MDTIPSMDPSRFVEQWVEPIEGDPVRCLIVPLTNRQRMHAKGQSVRDTGERNEKGEPIYEYEQTGMAWWSVKFGLRKIEHLVDRETGTDYHLVMQRERVAGRMMEVVSDTSMARLPEELIFVLANRISEISMLTPAEAEAIKNTLDSPSADSNALETSPIAPVPEES